MSLQELYLLLCILCVGIAIILYGIEVCIKISSGEPINYLAIIASIFLFVGMWMYTQYDAEQERNTRRQQVQKIAQYMIENEADVYIDAQLVDDEKEIILDNYVIFIDDNYVILETKRERD